MNHSHKDMRKYIYMLAALLAMASCSKSGLDIKSGNVIGEINVTATSGSLSVSVETVGRWIVYEADNADWVSFDVQGGIGKGAFTVSYQANLSNVVSLKSSRKARIVVTSEDYAKSDTLNIVQQGFDNSHKPSDVNLSKEIVLEYEQSSVKTLEIVYCSTDGVTDMEQFETWAAGFDVVACGNGFVGQEQQNGYAKHVIDDINLISADLSAATDEKMFIDMVDATYNAYNSPSKWIIGGQFYHYSMMQTSYPSTPSEFPLFVEDPLYDADRYAWNNNLYDCVWMAKRDFVRTWTSPEGLSYMADYVYVSKDVLAAIYSVEVLDKVYGMTHNPIKITLKY